MNGKSWIMYVVVNDTHGFLTEHDSYNLDIGYAKLFWTRDFAEATARYHDEYVMEVRLTLGEVSQ